MKKKLAWIAAAWPWLALAQAGGGTETLRVFADRLPSLRADGVQAVAVLTRREIEARAPASVPDLLRTIPGVHVDRLGNAGGAANTYIRGAEPNHTLVLVDGVRVNDPTDPRGGGYDLSSLAPQEIERIEVLRGASSAQFGPDAMGGIVNIVTRAGAGKPAAARLEAGAGGQGYASVAARGSFALPALSVSLGASRLEDGREADGGEMRLDTADVSLGHAGSVHAWRLRVRAADRESRQFPESSGGVRLAQSRELERRDAREELGSFAWEAVPGARWRVSANASALERREHRFSPAVAPGPGGFLPETVADTRLRRRGGGVQAAAGALPWESTVTLAAGAWREDGRRDSVLDFGAPLPASFDIRRETRSAFAQWEAALGPVGTLLALRHDDVQPGGSKVTRTAGARIDAGAAGVVRAQWSEGFKPPSFFSLADPLVGNPGLRPEESRSREVGWERRWETGWRAQATAFATRFSGLVDFDPATFRMVNRSGAQTKGVEAQVGFRSASGWLAEAGYTYVRATLDEEGARLRNRPRHRATLAAGYERAAWSARVVAAHVGRAFDFSIPTGDVELPAYTVVDAVARWRLGPLAATLALDNVTDRRYESFVGFAAPGRRLRAMVEAVF